MRYTMDFLTRLYQELDAEAYPDDKYRTVRGLLMLFLEDEQIAYEQVVASPAFHELVQKELHIITPLLAAEQEQEEERCVFDRKYLQKKLDEIDQISLQRGCEEARQLDLQVSDEAFHEDALQIFLMELTAETDVGKQGEDIFDEIITELQDAGKYHPLATYRLEFLLYAPHQLTMTVSVFIPCQEKHPPLRLRDAIDHVIITENFEEILAILRTYRQQDEHSDGTIRDCFIPLFDESTGEEYGEYDEYDDDY